MCYFVLLLVSFCNVSFPQWSVEVRSCWQEKGLKARSQTGRKGVEKKEQFMFE